MKGRESFLKTLPHFITIITRRKAEINELTDGQTNKCGEIYLINDFHSVGIIKGCSTSGDPWDEVDVNWIPISMLYTT